MSALAVVEGPLPGVLVARAHTSRTTQPPPPLLVWGTPLTLVLTDRLTVLLRLRWWCAAVHFHISKLKTDDELLGGLHAVVFKRPGTVGAAGGGGGGLATTVACNT